MALLNLCSWMSEETSNHTLLGAIFNVSPQWSRLQAWCLVAAGEASISTPEGVPPPGLGLWWQYLAALVPKEISELLHHTLPDWGTLPGMAKRLINIQIYSSTFNMKSMHIIKWNKMQIYTNSSI